MFSFARPRPRRRPALTPMIDVVFLLLVFFMLAAQFGRDGALPLSGAGGSAGYDGPPRLVTVMPQAVLLNGQAQDLEGLAAALADLTQSPDDAIILRAGQGATVQRISTVSAALNNAGFSRLILVE